MSEPFRNRPVVPDDAVYTSCWCEENVYLLGKYFAQSIPNIKEEWNAYVAFISNENKSVFLCQARHSTNPNLLRDNFGVVWDYHVILLLQSLKSPGATYVYDFDSRLPLGSLFEDYFRGTFPLIDKLHPVYVSTFRVIPLQMYLDYFASDRSHMLKPGELHENSEAKTYHSAPPAYPCIRGPLADTDNNLAKSYLQMSSVEVFRDVNELRREKWEDKPFGQLVSIHVFRSMFSIP
ncbi:hypothetical protein CPB86DRAFT_782814 [Serendipita vermifera]|nr:hypothetical protein CPB86DRAFT_782814 [Serendipita vermifera]